MGGGGAGGVGGAATTSTGGHGGAGGGGASGGSGGHAGGSGGGTTTSSDGGLVAGPVRIAAANLTSGNGQSWDPGEGIRILQGIHADVVLMQEMNYGNDSDSAIRDLVDQVCGKTCEYTRGSGQIPNGVVSRFPILEAGSWVDPKVQNRDFAYARLDVPGAVDLWVVSVHLLTSSPATRNAEGAALVSLVQDNVPEGDYLVVGGDFNTDVRDEPAMATLSAILSTAAPYPVDNLGVDGTNSTRKRPYDWLVPTPSLRARETAVTIGGADFPSGLVVDTRVYEPLADLDPAQKDDSGAVAMQHMAVVREFTLE